MNASATVSLMMRTVALPVGAFVLGVILTVLFCYSSNGASGEAAVSKDFIATSLVGATEITCTYPQLLSASFHEGKVNHELPPEETNPAIFTFSDFGGEVAKLKYIDATRTISETPIVKISEDEEKMVFVDGTGENYLATHMIFKSNGVAIYTKEVSLLGIPSGSLAVGTCIGL